TAGQGRAIEVQIQHVRTRRMRPTQRHAFWVRNRERPRRGSRYRKQKQGGRHSLPPLPIMDQFRRARASTKAKAPSPASKIPASGDPCRAASATPHPPELPPPMPVEGAQTIGPPPLTQSKPAGQGLAIMSQVRVQKCLLAPESKAQKPPWGQSASLLQDEPS